MADDEDKERERSERERREAAGAVDQTTGDSDHPPPQGGTGPVGGLLVLSIGHLLGHDGGGVSRGAGLSHHRGREHGHQVGGHHRRHLPAGVGTDGPQRQVDETAAELEVLIRSSIWALPLPQLDRHGLTRQVADHEAVAVDGVDVARDRKRQLGPGDGAPLGRENPSYGPPGRSPTVTARSGVPWAWDDPYSYPALRGILTRWTSKLLWPRMTALR
jgi:hypothetical protein